MTNFVNGAKQHENSVKNASHAESVGNILDNVENVPFALRGATVKTILYFLFSFIAAAELMAALTFYTMSMGASMIIAAVFCGAIAFGFHALLHGILSDTAKGIVFGKKKESGAMSNEVTGNIVLSIVLLAIAACSVFFIGKKGFTAYRATQYEKKAEDEKGKLPPIKSIDASMLTSKSGKISSYKLEMLGDLEKAKAKTTEAAQAKDESEATRYDGTTATITDIVGASAFLIELLLALLAYSIATAKLAATMDEIARRNGASQPQSQQAQATNGTTTPQNTPSVTPQTASPTTGNEGKVFIWNEQSDNVKRQILGTYLTSPFFDNIIVDTSLLRKAFDQVNPTITDIGNGGFKFDEAPIKAAYTALRASIEPPTPTPIQQKQIGFSDNKATKTGNEGRTVIQGFARKNSEKASVEANVEANVEASVVQTAPPPNTKVCQWCDEYFVYNIHNQKYCCEECRVSAYEDRSGKKLVKGKKK